MKNKLILLCALLSLAAWSAQAQNENIFDYENGWFVGAGIGANMGLDGGAYQQRELSHVGAGLTVDVYAGKFFSPRWGFRAGYQGVNTSNMYTAFGHSPFHYIHADALLRLGEVAVPYLHVGVAFMSKVTPVGGLGLMLPVRLSDRVALVPDLRASILRGSAFAGDSKGLGFQLSASIGVQYKL